MGASKCWHCGIPLQSSTKWVAAVEVVIGIFLSTIFGVYVKAAFENGSSYWESNTSYHGITYRRLHFLSREVGVTILVLHVIQIVMGLVLYFGAANKIRTIAQVWLAYGLVTAILLNYLILLRIYEMFIVYEFHRELKQEEVTYFPGQHELPEQAQKSQTPPHQQPPPAYPQPPPFDQYRGNNQNGGGFAPSVPLSIISGGGDAGMYQNYSQSYHNQYHHHHQPQQPIVATPMTVASHQFGISGYNGSQYSPQLPYNPAVKFQIPAALLPQSHSPTQYESIVVRDGTSRHEQINNFNGNASGVGYSSGAGYGLYSHDKKKKVNETLSIPLL